MKSWLAGSFNVKVINRIMDIVNTRKAGVNELKIYVTGETQDLHCASLTPTCSDTDCMLTLTVVHPLQSHQLDHEHYQSLQACHQASADLCHRSTVPLNSSVVLCMPSGHSLGGAIATRAAYDICKQLQTG